MQSLLYQSGRYRLLYLWTICMWAQAVLLSLYALLLGLTHLVISSNITAAEAVDREFGYIETKGEDLRHRHHHRHHHQHHPSIPKVSTEPPRVSSKTPPENPRAPWSVQERRGASRSVSRVSQRFPERPRISPEGPPIFWDDACAKWATARPAMKASIFLTHAFKGVFVAPSIGLA